jgi:integrase
LDRRRSVRRESEAEIERYRAHHPIGSTARLAVELLLGTGQRLSDAIRMGRHHVRDGAIHVVQQKTGAVVEAPILPVLAQVLAGAPSNLAFLVTQYGAPFSPKGFGEAFRGGCSAAACRAGAPRTASGRRAPGGSLKRAAIRTRSCRSPATKL